MKRKLVLQSCSSEMNHHGVYDDKGWHQVSADNDCNMTYIFWALEWLLKWSFGEEVCTFVFLACGAGSLLPRLCTGITSKRSPHIPRIGFVQSWWRGIEHKFQNWTVGKVIQRVFSVIVNCSETNSNLFTVVVTGIGYNTNTVILFTMRLYTILKIVK